MLYELDVLEAKAIADLALEASKVRDRLLEKIADTYLDDPAPARGEHNPLGGIVLDDVLAGEREFVALREALVALPREIRIKLLLISQIGRGDLTPADWAAAFESSTVFTDDDIIASLSAEPDLHNLLQKGLYLLRSSSPRSDDM